VKAFEYRRVKNDERDAKDLADLPRMGRLPEAWIAPPAVRELREIVRHRAKLVSVRSQCKAEIHAVLAKCGVQITMTDLFGVSGRELLDQVALPTPYRARIDSLRRVMDALEFEIEVFAGLARVRLVADPGYAALQTIPGIGQVLATVFVAEIGDVHRFTGPDKLASWSGLTPKHHESDTHVHRGRITKINRAHGWCAGQRWNRYKPCPRSPSWGRCVSGSPRAEATTSAWWPPPANKWASSPTRCATTTSARHNQVTTTGRVRHDRTGSGVGAGRPGHDPHQAWSLLLIDPADPSTAHPIMPPTHAGGEGMTAAATACHQPGHRP
jgi:hypothetical protein